MSMRRKPRAIKAQIQTTQAVYGVVAETICNRLYDVGAIDRSAFCAGELWAGLRGQLEGGSDAASVTQWLTASGHIRSDAVRHAALRQRWHGIVLEAVGI